MAGIDAAIFGGVRSRLLERIHSAGPEYAWRAGGTPIQYCLGRTGRLFNQIGPIAATTAQTAIALAAAALPNAGDHAVVVDAYDEHEEFTAWLGASGFEAQRPLYRMRRPGSQCGCTWRARAVDRVRDSRAGVRVSRESYGAAHAAFRLKAEATLS